MMRLAGIAALWAIGWMGLPAFGQHLSPVEQLNHHLKVCELQEFAPATDSLYQACKAQVDARLNEDGSVIEGFVKEEIEQMALGNALNCLYRHTQDARYKKASNWIHHYLVMSYPRNKKTTAQNLFLYSSQTPYQMRLETPYWGVTFLAGWITLFDNKNVQAWGDVTDQFKLLHTQTYNAATGLNYTLWCADMEKDSTEGLVPDGVFKGCLPTYHALSMARYWAALVDVTEIMPAQQPDYPILCQLTTTVAQGLQGWYDSTTHQWAETMVYEEGETPVMDAEATDLLTATFFKALRLGLLKDKSYQELATSAFQACQQPSALLRAEQQAWQKAQTVTKRTPIRRAGTVHKKTSVRSSSSANRKR